jgi:polar amino acid transport system substrate-binding protein
MGTMKKLSLFLFILLISVQFHLSAELEPIEVGADVDYAPYSFIKDGQAAGFDIDFFKLLASKLSYAPDFTLAHWYRIQGMALDGELDAVLGVLYSPDRDEYLDFTVPYNTVRLSLIVPENSSIRRPGDIAGKTMAYLKDDVLPELMLGQLSIAVNKKRYDTLSLAVKSVERGECDFCIVPFSYIKYSLKRKDLNNLRILEDERLTAKYHIGITEQNTGIISELNTAIRAVLQSSEYENLQQKWLFPNGSREKRTGNTSAVPVFLYVIISVSILGFGGMIILLKKLS